MKVHVEIDMTPDEARRFMGLPDVAPLQDEMVAEMESRMKAAIDTADPEAMMRAWMPLGGQGLQQFQRFMWDSAKRAATGGAGRKTRPSADAWRGHDLRAFDGAGPRRDAVVRVSGPDATSRGREFVG